MLRRANRSSKFFHTAKSPNEQTKLRNIVSHHHHIPIDNRSIEERIMEMLPDDEEDSIILNDQGIKSIRKAIDFTNRYSN
jgi:hypothetical protein